MDTTQVSTLAIWNEIDLSERYMVCGMFNEAISLASFLIQRLNSSSLEPIHENELPVMMESAGMVFIQSLIELGRTPELFVELRSIYGSLEAIPIQVFLTGACMQISEGLTSDLTAIFEEFLDKWRYVENNDHVFPKENQNCSKCKWQYALDLEKYIEAAEIFTIALLGRLLCKPELAISWTAKASLPEEKRQDILRKLQSLHIGADSSSSPHVETVQAVEKIGKTPYISPNNTHTKGHDAELASSKGASLSIKYSSWWHQNILLWWFSNFRLKFGGTDLVLPRGRTVVVCLVMALASYFLRRRASEIKNFTKRQALFIQRALVDVWQLAFSVQVNPLAAVQQLPATPRGSR